ALVPTPTARRYCEGRLEKTTYCVMTQIPVDKCLEGWKMYSDEILAQLDDCREDRICKNYDRCSMSVVGPDIYWDDPDRRREWLARSVAIAPPTTIVLGVTVHLMGQLWPGVTICVDRHPELPCATTGPDGGALLTLPASS